MFSAIHDGAPDQALLSYQYLQMLPQLAQGEANKIFVIPTEFSQALANIAAQLRRAARRREAEAAPARGRDDARADARTPRRPPAPPREAKREAESATTRPPHRRRARSRRPRRRRPPQPAAAAGSQAGIALMRFAASSAATL